MKNRYYSLIIFALAFCFQGYSQCFEDTHTPFGEDSWVSCEETSNPNPVRPVSHWIMYDLGYEYVLDSTHIWNLNTWGDKDAGIKEAVLDYSLDGVNWISLDTFMIEQAIGSYKYQGVKGPSFGNVAVRYVLLTALSNWGNEDCTGLSEMRFGVSEIVSNDPTPVLSDDFMEVSPNPVKDFANVSIKSDVLPERVALYDLAGRLIEERNNVRSKNVIFTMKGLVGGIYIVKASVDGKALTEKIVKVE